MLAALYCLYFLVTLTENAYRGKTGWWKKYLKVCVGGGTLGFVGAYLSAQNTTGERALEAAALVSVGLAVVVLPFAGMAWLLKPRNKLTASQP